MFLVPLNVLPNQTVSFNIDGAYWQVHVYQAKTSVCADIVRDGVNIALGVRCYVGELLMQYEYMYAPNFGNFVFDSNVDWSDFGVSCNLYYLQKEELSKFLEMVKAGLN